MKFNELKIGQQFRFSFERNGQWVYEKLDDEYFKEIQRPFFYNRPFVDDSEKVFSIEKMNGDDEVVPYVVLNTNS